MPDWDLEKWIHPAVILVATDLSDLDRLMPFALQQAHDTGARLVLLNVLTAGTGIALDAAGILDFDSSSAVEYATSTLKPWCDLARAQELTCTAAVREGNAAHQILASLVTLQADRLILGTRSRSKMSKLLLGSVAEQVLRSANLPVITVGPEAYLTELCSGQIRVVLHAAELKETSSSSAALACQIAASQRAKLVLLHVRPPIDARQPQGQSIDYDSTAKEDLRVLAAKSLLIAEAGATHAASCVPVETEIVHGHPSIEILAASVEQHASLIVLGNTLRPALQTLTRDRTIYRVVAHARCPVLTLRDPLATPTPHEEEQLARHI